MSTEITKTSQIRIDVHLDKESLPAQIEWDADDAEFEGKQPAKGIMLSIFDGLQQNAMRIDLWTNDMQVDEMNLLFYQTFHAMADTLKNATGNEEAALNIKAFANMFGENTDVVKKVE
jgi:gliding motility-associated protein GldC